MRPHRAAGGVARVVWAACLATALLGCGDDANDARPRAERAARLAAELRAGEPPSDTVELPSADASAGGAPAVEPTGVVVPVIALDNSFRPDVIEVAVGDEVVWENRGQNEHDVLRVDGDGWGVEVDGFQPGDVYAHVFTEPGEFRYYCSIHGNEDVGMVGTVVVNG